MKPKMATKRIPISQPKSEPISPAPSPPPELVFGSTAEKSPPHSAPKNINIKPQTAQKRADIMATTLAAESTSTRRITRLDDMPIACCGYGCWYCGAGGGYSEELILVSL